MQRTTAGLLILLALGVLAAPFAAAQTRKVARIGLLDYTPSWEPFLQGLRELGYRAGENLHLEYRPTEGRRERLPALAAELVRLPVDVLVTAGAVATRAAQEATTTIPIVMMAVGDPVRTGIVASLAQPGGNVTGSTILGAELSAKRLQLLHEALPTLARVAFLWNPANIANRLHFDDIAQGAQALGVTLHSVEVSTPEGFDRAFAVLSAERPDALIMTADPLHQLHVGRIIAFAAQHRLRDAHMLRRASPVISHAAMLKRFPNHRNIKHLENGLHRHATHIFLKYTSTGGYAKNPITVPIIRLPGTTSTNLGNHQESSGKV